MDAVANVSQSMGIPMAAAHASQLLTRLRTEKARREALESAKLGGQMIADMPVHHKQAIITENAKQLEAFRLQLVANWSNLSATDQQVQMARFSDMQRSLEVQQEELAAQIAAQAAQQQLQTAPPNIPARTARQSLNSMVTEVKTTRWQSHWAICGTVCLIVLALSLGLWFLRESLRGRSTVESSSNNGAWGFVRVLAILGFTIAALAGVCCAFTWCRASPEQRQCSNLCEALACEDGIGSCICDVLTWIMECLCCSPCNRCSDGLYYCGCSNAAACMRCCQADMCLSTVRSACTECCECFKCCECFQCCECFKCSDLCTNVCDNSCFTCDCCNDGCTISCAPCSCQKCELPDCDCLPECDDVVDALGVCYKIICCKCKISV